MGSESRLCQNKLGNILFIINTRVKSAFKKFYFLHHNVVTIKDSARNLLRLKLIIPAIHVQ